MKNITSKSKRLTSFIEQSESANSLGNSMKHLKTQHSNSLIRPRPTMILDQRSDIQEGEQAQMFDMRCKQSPDQSRVSKRQDEKSDITEVSSLKSNLRENKEEVS